MTINSRRRISSQTLFVGITLIALGGCGGAEAKKPNDFFTSGSREADQRADQRMAKDSQLKDAKASGSSSSGGSSKEGAAKTDVKLSLYERLGGDAGISSIVEDFVPRPGRPARELEPQGCDAGRLQLPSQPLGGMERVGRQRVRANDRAQGDRRF